MYNKGENVDAETKLALTQMKDEIIKQIAILIDEKNSILERYIKETSDLKFERVNADLDRHNKYHSEHFEKINEISDKTDSIKIEILDDIKNNSRFRWEILISVGSVIIAAIALIVSNLS